MPVSRGDPRLGAAIFIGLGALSFVGGIAFLAASRRRRSRCSEAVVAKVVENALESSVVGTGQDRRTVSVYRPVLEFEFGGRTVRARGNSGSNPPAHKVGDSVEIRVNPADPAEFVSGSGKIEAVVSAAMILFGLAFSAIGALVAASA